VKGKKRLNIFQKENKELKPEKKRNNTLDMRVIVYLLLILANTRRLTVNANDCIFSSCFCFDESINCRARELTAVPLSNATNKLNYKQLSLSNNNIVHLASDSFVGLNLSKVWFRFNNLRTLSKHAFRDAVGIAMISFQSNRIQEVEDETFEPLSDSLNILSINMNEFVTVPDLSGMHVLEQLNLSHNQIKTLDSKDGSYGPLFPVSLKALALNMNFLEKIDGSWFEDLVNLESLNLAGNRISTIDNGALDALSNLVLLDLSNNSIVHISNKWFFKLDRAENVILSYQQAEIESIDNHAFDSDKTKVVNTEYFLEGNTIKKMSERAFCPRRFPPNSKDTISLNRTTLVNINPCILRQIASSRINDLSVVSNAGYIGDNIDFNCLSLNYFARLNLNVVLTHQNDTSNSVTFNYRNCPRRLVNQEVCADFIKFNCYDPIIFINFTRNCK
jgi:Leucine-rich repeat (LRR) protein